MTSRKLTNFFIFPIQFKIYQMDFPLQFFIFLFFLLPSLVFPFECGNSEYFSPKNANNESAHHFKISNGDRVENDAKYPWMAAFMRDDEECCSEEEKGTFCYCCSASIIGPRHLLLAAHCFYSTEFNRFFGKEEAAEYSQIRVGDVDYLSEKSISPKIAQVFVHPKFDIKNLANDIAIIELANSLNFTQNIRPICLAKEFNESSQILGPRAFKNGKGRGILGVIIAGWGRQHEGIYGFDSQEIAREPDERPEMLFEGRAHPISLEECKKKIHPNNNWSLDERNICMGIGHENAEKGDSGSPVFLQMAQGNGAKMLHTEIGITSFTSSHNSEEERPPVIYTRVSAFCGWISESTSGEVECI